MSPEITITSEELRERVEDRLDRWIPDAAGTRADPHPRHKNEVNRQRHPEIDYYDNDYLVLLTADTVRETEFSDLTPALCDLTVARAQ
uniref:chitinase n=1 Tax=Faecalibacterium prausnitzii TaxID=853 RepID=UPI00403879F9